MPMHPTYKALPELGKAVKTIFLCRYLGSESLSSTLAVRLHSKPRRLVVPQILYQDPYHLGR